MAEVSSKEWVPEMGVFMSFGDDVLARSRDFEVMKRLLRIRMTDFRVKEDGSLEFINPDEKKRKGEEGQASHYHKEFLMSPEYRQELLDTNLPYLMAVVKFLDRRQIKTPLSEEFSKMRREELDGVYKLEPINPQQRQRIEEAKKKLDLEQNLQKELGKLKIKTIKSSNSTGEIRVASLNNGWRETTVTMASVNSLKPGAYLNDEVLDFAMVDVLVEKNYNFNIVHMPVFAWQSYIFLDLNSEVPLRKINALFKLMTKNGEQPDLSKIEYLIIPIIRENHWFLAIVVQPFLHSSIIEEAQAGISSQTKDHLYNSWIYHPRPPMILLFDSMMKRMKSKVEDYDLFLQESALYIKKALVNVHKVFLMKTLEMDIEINYQESPWSSIQTIVMQVPSQPNKEDCGLHCIVYLSVFFDKLVENGNQYKSLIRTDFSDVIDTDNLPVTRPNVFKRICNNCAKNYSQHFAELEKLNPQLAKLSFQLKEEVV